MKHHTYDSETLEYVSSEDTHPSPVDKGAFLLPANATHKVPPTFDQDKFRCTYDPKKDAWSVTRRNVVIVGATPLEVNGWDQYQIVAAHALKLSDEVVLRCYESQIPVPPEWVEYRKQLRVIGATQDGDPTREFPTIPPYPKD